MHDTERIQRKSAKIISELREHSCLNNIWLIIRDREIMRRSNRSFDVCVDECFFRNKTVRRTSGHDEVILLKEQLYVLF